MNSRKQYLINQYQDTLEYLEVLKQNLRLDTSVIFTHTNNPYVPKRVFPNLNTKIHIYNRDVIGVITDLHLEYPDDTMLVMNLASRLRYGGGYQTGALAQEEELFRKTDYCLHPGEHMYPLEKDKFLCTPYVTVVKDENYNRLPVEKLFKVDMIAISAINKPTLVNSHLSNQDYKYTKMLISNTFEFGIQHGYKHLVLGALGCGVFKNPPTDIANIYNECIEKYKGWFETISFAVLSKGTDQNYEIFNTIIQQTN